jgi:mono/diheme cytochrome c family protein
VKASVALVLIALPAMRAASTPKVTFYQNIAPIIYKNCSSCHRPGESGPFPLLSYDDVRKHAAQIADVTKRRYMPPWLPETGHGDFLEERRLSDAEIQAIEEWVAQRTPPGSASHPPQPPKFTSEWALGTPDLVLHIPKPYQLAADGPEVFWNFVVPVPVARERWVKAMEVRPGNPRVFHHANVIIDRSQSARRLDWDFRGWTSHSRKPRSTRTATFSPGNRAALRWWNPTAWLGAPILEWTWCSTSISGHPENPRPSIR